jgi:hypothetical protein
MADYYINIFLDEEKIKKLEGVGLSGEIQEIHGKKAIRVGVTAKEQKKLAKSFPDLAYDASNACVLPEKAEDLVMNMIISIKSMDVMKGAILKLYNPFAGKELLQKTF